MIRSYSMIMQIDCMPYMVASQNLRTNLLDLAEEQAKHDLNEIAALRKWTVFGQALNAEIS